MGCSFKAGGRVGRPGESKPMRSVFASALALSTAVSGGVLAASLALPANAQQTDLRPIRQVVVEGNERIEARTIQSYLLLEPGDAFDPSRIDLSLKTLFATGLFADVRIDRRDADLVVRVVENPIINQVIFEGNTAVGTDKLIEEIQASPRGVFTAARVQQDVQRILEVYRRNGRFAANVVPQYKPLNQNRVDLIFEVTEGPVTGVRSINFIGNSQYTDRRLRTEIVTRQSRLWRFFSSNDNYDPDRLEFDRELLRQFYANEGYADFRVVSAVAELTPDQKDFYITFTIDEGVKYDFGEVRVETALEKLNSDALRAIVPIREGDLYKGDLIEDSVDALTFAAGVAGYAFVDVRPRIERNPETRTVDIVFSLDEGPRVYVERININGNTRTLDRVIRREMRISEGDAFNRILIDQSRNRVRALGFFKEVEVEEVPGTLADRTVVNFNVEEQPTGEVSFAAGFSSLDSFLFDLNLSERNWRGRGQQLRARLSTSSRQTQLDFRFTEPRFLDRNLAAGIDVYATRTDYLDIAGYEANSIGGGVRVGFPLSDRTQMGLRYTLRSDEIDVENRNIVIDGDGVPFTREQELSDANGDPLLDENGDPVTVTVAVTPDDITSGNVALPEGGAIVDQCSPQNVLRLNFNTLCDDERSDLSSILGYSVSMDRRNDPIAPTRGFTAAISQDVAGLGGDVNYIRTEFNGAVYRGIFPGVRATARISAGHVEAWADDDLRINNRFFKGGSSFRGFDVAGIGPRAIFETFDANGNLVQTQRGSALGGKVYGIGSLELTVPNFLPEEYGIRSALFLDAGTLGFLDDNDVPDPVRTDLADGGYTIFRVDDEASLRASGGVSIAWDSPFGPIRFDFAQILRSEDYDRTETFRFSTSTTF